MKHEYKITVLAILSTKKHLFSLITALIVICTVLTACSSQSGTEDSHLESIPVSSQILDNAAISYLGPEGTYTEEAAKYFFKTGDFSPMETVDDAISDVISNTSDYAVIPQENTLGGTVTSYVDALIENKDVYVVGEVILPINQTLMGLPGSSISDIKTVCSHAQGLAQSEKWRKENLPDAGTQEMDSTAAAASYVAKSNDKTEAPQTNASFVASCSADLIDDIIVKVHDSGAELVTIHDRPKGSALGTYNYIIEIEDKDGLSDKQISEITSFSEIRYLGKFNVAEKSAQK